MLAHLGTWPRAQKQEAKRARWFIQRKSGWNEACLLGDGCGEQNKAVRCQGSVADICQIQFASRSAADPRQTKDRKGPSTVDTLSDCPFAREGMSQVSGW